MKLYEKMQKYLANQQVLFIKLHNLHWYLTGTSFYTLHEKFEELYDATAEIIDDVAERLLALEEKPVASLKEALKLADVEELPDEAISGDKAIAILKADFESAAKQVKEISELAADNDDSVTEGMFDDYLGEYQKNLWMIRAYTS